MLINIILIIIIIIFILANIIITNYFIKDLLHIYKRSKKIMIYFCKKNNFNNFILDSNNVFLN